MAALQAEVLFAGITFLFALLLICCLYYRSGNVVVNNPMVMSLSDDYDQDMELGLSAPGSKPPNRKSKQVKLAALKMNHQRNPMLLSSSDDEQNKKKKMESDRKHRKMTMMQKSKDSMTRELKENIAMTNNHSTMAEHMEGNRSYAGLVANKIADQLTTKEQNGKTAGDEMRNKLRAGTAAQGFMAF